MPNEPNQTAQPSEADSFNAFYQVQPESPRLKAIFREALGLTALSAEIVPYSFVTLADLQRSAGLLQLNPGQRLADLACGNGSLGLWLAQQLNVHLTGVDYAAVAISAATAKAQRFGLTESSQFQIGSFEQLGLASASVDGAVSFDALWLAQDQQRALFEVARVLRPGARFVFTSWEQRIPLPMVKQPVRDYRPLLAQAGFTIEAYEYLWHSEAVMQQLYAQVRAQQAQLLTEMGEAARSLIGEAHFVPGLIDGVNYIAPENGPHVLVCARRA